jgi:predicted chitinase
MRGAIENIPTIKNGLASVGILNKTLQDAIIAVIGKESNFKPQNENLNYSAKRIREVWPYITPEQAKNLEKKPIALANYVYGGKYGNDKNMDGWNFRGRSYNQITFKNTYKKIGDQIGVDLIKNPDLLNDKAIAAKATAQYFKNTFSANKANIKNLYGIDINNIPPGTDPLKILRIAVNANAGFGKSTNIVNTEYQKALQYFEYATGKKNYFIPIAIGALLLFFALKK